MTGRAEGAVAFIAGAGRGGVFRLAQGDAVVKAAGLAGRVDAACTGRSGFVAPPGREGEKA
jgi:hypothetical protein